MGAFVSGMTNASQQLSTGHRSSKAACAASPTIVGAALVKRRREHQHGALTAQSP